MGSAVVEKTEEELRKQIEELHRQQWEITERLRDPRGLRRGGLSGAGPRNFSANDNRQRGFVRTAERTESEDQPAVKRRLSSAVVKIEDGEIVDDEPAKDGGQGTDKDFILEESVEVVDAKQRERNWTRRDGDQRPPKMDYEAPPPVPVPRVFPKDEDPSLVKRNKRMLGQLLGTLERFRKEELLA